VWFSAAFLGMGNGKAGWPLVITEEKQYNAAKGKTLLC
jgi:hypothetical protein